MEISLSDFVFSFLAAGGGASAVSFLLFKSLGEKWIDSKFTREIEKYRNESAKEFAIVQAKIDGSLNATIRYQEKEFNALSECWQKANLGYGAILSYVSPLQRYENIDKASADARKEILEMFDLLPSQRKEILEAREPQATFIFHLSRLKSNSANEALHAFTNSFYLNEIFMDEATSKGFKKIVDGFRKVYQKRKWKRRV